MTYLQSLIFTLMFLCFPVSGMCNDEGWVLTTNNRDNYNGITLANGRIGIVTNSSLMSVSEVVLNGVFDKEFEGGVSRMVRGPLFMNLRLKVNGVELNEKNVTGWNQTFNMKEACLKTSFSYNGMNINYTMRAMRNLPYMGIGELTIESKKDADVEVINDISFPEELKDIKTNFRTMRDGKVLLPVLVTESKSRSRMNDIATCTAFLLPNEKRNNVKEFKDGDRTLMSYTHHVKEGSKCIIPVAGAICTSRDFSDAKGEAERMAVYAMQHNYNELINGHINEWAELWKGDIIIEGCPSDQLDVRMALYNLYSFQREGSRLSISPMGLSSSQGYNGHVFWDSEIWMFPPMLVFNPQLARGHIDYRYDRLNKALQRASMLGYKGAMYPWESDDNGEESTPTWCLTGTFEHHVTADIGIAFWNYYRVTKDRQWLKDEGYTVIKAVADFWVSRAVKNSDGSYSINNVVGADEYAQNIDDNAFTNGAAKVALANAVKAARVLNTEPDKQWQKVSYGLCFHYMKNGTTMEHATYNGKMVKQADVNLLAYPLGIVTDKNQILRDLKYYEDKIDKLNGPAMGNSILSILYSRLGDTDKAYELFHKSYMPNKRPPFGVLSESASSNNPYFATGAGGMLQAVIFGFAGFDLTDEGIIQHKTSLPKQWKSLTIKGLDFKEKTITITR